MRRIIASIVVVTAFLAVSASAANAGPPAVAIGDLVTVSVGPELPSGCGPYCMVDVDVTVSGKGSYVLEVASIVDGVARGWDDVAMRGSGTRTYTLHVGVPSGSTAILRASIARANGMTYQVIATKDGATPVTCPGG